MTREEAAAFYDAIGIVTVRLSSSEEDRLEQEAIREVLEEQCLGQGFDVRHWPKTIKYMKFNNNWPWKPYQERKN